MVGPPRDDEELLAQLRAAAGQADPVPPGVVEAARAALSMRALDAELLELTADSAAAGAAPAATRAGSPKGFYG